MNEAKQPAEHRALHQTATQVIQPLGWADYCTELRRQRNPLDFRVEQSIHMRLQLVGEDAGKLTRALPHPLRLGLRTDLPNLAVSHEAEMMEE
jgi:hypothetical protein